MNTDGGWIKTYRSLLNWEWAEDPVMVKAYVFILLLCSSVETRWHGQVIHPGEFVTSLSRLSEIIGISLKKTRTVLERLKMTGEIETITSKKYTIIHVKNWGTYQATPNPQPEIVYSQGVNLDFCKSIPNKGQTKGKERANNGYEKRQSQPPYNQQDNSEQGQTKGKAPDSEMAEKGQQSRIKNKDIDSIYLNICPKISEDADLFGNPMPEEIKSCLSFEDFWKIYDKKVDKSACRSLYDKLPETTREEIKRHVPLYVQSTPDKTYRKDPVRYLRHRCWENEIIENTKQPQINREEEGF